MLAAYKLVFMHIFLQATTTATVANDISTVNRALQTKLSQTEQLKVRL